MVDTRTKIIALDEMRERLLAPAPPRALVIGHFDPVVYTNVERMLELAAEYGPLAVCVTSPADPLLPARARAELAAALDCTEFVTMADHAETSVLTGIPGLTVIDETHDDLRRREALMALVRERQKA
jgi:hypothetical protein